MERSLEKLTILTFLLGGFGDVDKYIQSLATQMKQTFGAHFFHFKYEYSKRLLQLKTIASMDSLAERFYNFIRDSCNGIEGAVKINIVGYSQGGMLALYTLGKYPSVLKNLNRFVSIASPHAGIFKDVLRTVIGNTFNGIKGLFSEEKGIFGALWRSAMEFGGKQLDIFGLLTHDSDFLNNTYPLVASRVFDQIPKSQLLEIYSIKDFVAPPESTRRFKAHMETFQINYGDHLDIPRSQVVIGKVLDFLGK